MKVVSLVAILFALNVYAEDNDRNHINQQQLSRRPYAQAPAPKAESIEGDVVDVQEIELEKKQKTIQLHNLGRRPYAEKNTD